MIKFVVCCCWIVSLAANAPDNLFLKYPNNVFVETGTWRGNGVIQAIKAGFTEIYSIEKDDQSFKFASKRLAEYAWVHLYLADSTKFLKNMIKEITHPITFWLDAHTDEKSLQAPLLSELLQIAQHPIKTHTILIDDVRLFGRRGFAGVSVARLQKILLSINHNYEFSFEDGCDETTVFKNDIFVSQIKNCNPNLVTQ